MSISLAAAVGPIGAKALRKARALADEAPLGRLFSSIATLIDASSAAESAIASGDMPRAARAIAALELASDGDAARHRLTA